MGPVTVRRRAAALLLAGLLAALFALYVATTGGIDTRLGSVPIRSRSWERPATVALALLGAGLFLVRHAFAAVPGRVFKALPAIILVWGTVAAFTFGTYAAGGADSFGYISQAELLAHGRLTDRMPSHPAFDWPDVPATLTPLAYTRGPDPAALVPVYPPGLSLLMAPLTWIHPSAVFLVVPLCAAVTLWGCLLLGRELEDPVAGTLGALLVSVSPTFLLQAAQPMSDVPVTAAWLAALLGARRPHLAGAALAGAAASLAIMIRPNLAPLAVLVVAACATAIPPGGGFSRVLTRMTVSGACMLPGVLALAAIQNVRYGSPLGSGYGSFGDLFALSNIGPNLLRYPRWLTLAHSPFLWLWLLAPLWFRAAGGSARQFGWIGYGFTAAVVAAYLPYVYFRPEEWSYTRFLLPALPFMLVFSCGVLLAAARRWMGVHALRATALLVAAIAVWCVYTAASLGVFRMREAERKYPEVGTFVRDQLPQSAFVFALQHSGSIRYYSHRPTFRWDLLDNGSLDRALRALRAAGYVPYLAADGEEDEAFRERFGAVAENTVSNLAPVGVIGNTTVYAFK